jgi:hypothetical protein
VLAAVAAESCLSSECPHLAGCVRCQGCLAAFAGLRLRFCQRVINDTESAGLPQPPKEVGKPPKEVGKRGAAGVSAVNLQVHKFSLWLCAAWCCNNVMQLSCCCCNHTEWPPGMAGGKTV